MSILKKIFANPFAKKVCPQCGRKRPHLAFVYRPSGEVFSWLAAEPVEMPTCDDCRRFKPPITRSYGSSRLDREGGPYHGGRY